MKNIKYIDEVKEKFVYRKIKEKRQLCHIRIQNVSILFFLSFLTFLLYLSIRNKTNVNQKKLLFLKKINETFEKNNYININEVESMIPKGRPWTENKNKKNEINIGFQLDPSYILRAMMTLASIMDSQKPETKIRFHFAVVLSFKAEDMLKIYSLRETIREDVEFNFYNSKKVEIDLKNLNTKGPGAVAKLLLPELLPDNIEKLIIFDTGDLLVLRDLSKMINLNMHNYLYLGAPGAKVGKYSIITKKNIRDI